MIFFKGVGETTIIYCKCKCIIYIKLYFKGHGSKLQTLELHKNKKERWLSTRTSLTFTNEKVKSYFASVLVMSSRFSPEASSSKLESEDLEMRSDTLITKSGGKFLNIFILI